MHRLPIGKLILAALLLASVFSCTVKVDPDIPDSGDGLSLVFSCDDISLVKATQPVAGIDTLNENKLASVEYFLYPDGRTNENAVLHGYLTNVTSNTPYPIAMTDAVVSGVLCPNNAKFFYVYAVANHERIVPAPAPNASEDLSNTSVSNLEAITRDIDLNNNGKVKVKQDNFLMATDGAVKSPQIKRHQTTIATVDVNLKRVAAKLTVLVRTPQSVTIDNTVTIGTVTDVRHEVWVPRTNEMTVYLVNGAKTGQVSGLPYASSTFFDYPAQTFDLTSGESHNYSTYVYHEAQGEEGQPGYVAEYYEEVTATGTFNPCYYPFYTYPLSWVYGSDDEPYLKLMIPWDRQPGTSEGGLSYGTLNKQYYYRVYCPGTTATDGIHNAEFLRNNWYKIVLNVAILGSEIESGAIEIQGNYYVADWQEHDDGTGNDTDKEAEIKGARYLFVNDLEYNLYNVDSLMIPYVTSDPCEIVSATAYRTNFNGSSSSRESTTNLGSWNMTLETKTTESGAHVKFVHNLNNDLSGTNYDVSEYEIVFTLRQKDATSYAKTITIRQSPSITISMEDNSSGTHYGYTYVNNGENTGDYGTYGTNGTSTGNNTNFNIFTVSTSVLPANSDYMLGDPRLTTIDNLNSWPTRNSAVSNWSATAQNRKLSYYYPVDNSSTADNIIAPSFKVASSHGATGTLSYANAFRRCASYQEKGYPAGRWRLPTIAEISYITKLNADGKIVRLFGSSTNGETTDYWCNSGYVTVYDGTDAASKQAPVPHPGVTSGNKYVRCVYDEWYWGNDKISSLTTFTWGDEARPNN